MVTQHSYSQRKGARKTLPITYNVVDILNAFVVDIWKKRVRGVTCKWRFHLNNIAISLLGLKIQGALAYFEKLFKFLV